MVRWGCFRIECIFYVLPHGCIPRDLEPTEESLGHLNEINISKGKRTLIALLIFHKSAPLAAQAQCNLN